MLNFSFKFPADYVNSRTRLMAVLKILNLIMITHNRSVSSSS